MATTQRVITDEELLRLPRDGSKYEVVDGELVRMSPAGWLHERIIMRLAGALVAHVQVKRLGDVIGSSAMYVLPGGNKRCPDISFVAEGRLKSETGRPFPELAPDLAVEIVSPSDGQRQVLDKVGEYLQAGVRLVWVIEPEKRQATAYRGLTDVQVIAATGSLEGEDVLPGFRCPLTDILD
jgi:Uma2 family endonuclease